MEWSLSGHCTSTTGSNPLQFFFSFWVQAPLQQCPGGPKTTPSDTGSNGPLDSEFNCKQCAAWGWQCWGPPTPCLAVLGTYVMTGFVIVIIHPHIILRRAELFIGVNLTLRTVLIFLLMVCMFFNPVYF